MRQTTTAELRLDDGKPPSSGLDEAEHLAVSAGNRFGCDQISLTRSPHARKITSNRTGIRRMSDKPTKRPVLVR